VCKLGFYDGSSSILGYIEIAILLEDIALPALPPFPTVEELQSGNIYYPRAEELYTDMKGKFSIPILNPLAETSEPVETDAGTGTVRNILNNSSIMITPYKESNYVELNIPKYILLNFVDTVPKGTKFLVCFIGGSIKVKDIRVIGVN
jgi:hypothetical protein